MTTIKVKEFCTNPGPGLIKDGTFSGEEFREDFVRPAFNLLYELIRNEASSTERLTIDMDGAYGYSNQWLEEVFGGMIFYNSYPEATIFGKYVLIKCDEEPYLLDSIQKIVGDGLEYCEAQEKKNTSSPKNNEDDERNAIGPKQHIYVAGEQGVGKLLICKNNFAWPCWCCKHSPDFKGTEKDYNSKCEHGFINGFGCGTCDIECQDLCIHYFPNHGQYCTYCNPVTHSYERCQHGHRKTDCTVCKMFCEHGFKVQVCGVCAKCPHGYNQNGLGCDKCEDDDIVFDGTVWRTQSFEQAMANLDRYQDDAADMSYFQGLIS